MSAGLVRLRGASRLIQGTSVVDMVPSTDVFDDVRVAIGATNIPRARTGAKRAEGPPGMHGTQTSRITKRSHCHKTV